MLSGNERQVWVRIRCAALLAGYRGPGELFDAIDRPGLAYRTVRRMASGEAIDESIEVIAEAVSGHCATRGVPVPVWWLLGGFDEQPDPGDAAEGLTAARESLSVAVDRAVRALGR